jgi:hypothetical protein
MIPFGFYSLVSAWLAALIPLLIVFYFLKLRRPRVEVPSLVLWRRVMEDRRVNSPFQRFKRNILLFLQLLLLLLLILAAMQPYFRRRAKPLRRLPVLVDCSASMAALDKPGGNTRLAEAKKRVGALIDNLLPNQEICLLSFAGTARRKTDFTNNRRVLHEALDALTVQDVPSNLDEAMQVVQALLRQTTFEEIMLVSDGNLPKRINSELSFDVNYQILEPAGPNAGITALNARSAGADRWDVFAVLAASGDRPRSCVIEVRRGRDTIAEEQIVLTPGTPERLMFPVEATEAGLITARLTVDGFDSLASDNTAFLPLPRLRPLTAYVAEPLASYRHALEACADVELVRDAAAQIDLAVVDTPDGVVQTIPVLLSVGVIPDELQAFLGRVNEPTEVVDWQRDCDLLRHVQLRDVTILDYPVLKPGAGPGDVEAQGFDILAESSHGPLILRREFPTRLQYYLLFHTDRSTLPYRVGFPILVSNVVADARVMSGLSEVRAPETGVLPVIEGVPGAACVVTGPGGMREQRVFAPSGTLEGVPAPLAGPYTAVTGGATIPTGASLLNEQETLLTRIEELQFRENLSVAAAVEPVKAEQPLWQALAIVAFAAMLVEWWWYQRKAG